MLSKNNLQSKQFEPIDGIEPQSTDITKKSRFRFVAPSQQQIFQGSFIGAVVLITIVCGFILWSLLNTGTFVPYQGASQAPQTANIITFVVLFSIIVAGIFSMGGTIAFTVWQLARKKPVMFNQKLFLSLYFLAVFYVLVTTLFHVFKVIHFGLSLLFFGIFWGIVWYARTKSKNRLTKYAPKGSRRGNSPKDEVQA